MEVLDKHTSGADHMEEIIHSRYYDLRDIRGEIIPNTSRMGRPRRDGIKGSGNKQQKYEIGLSSVCSV